MKTEVYLSVLAEKHAETLRGADLRSFVAFVNDLETRGCATPGYRLTGELPVSRLCVKHSRGAMRVVVAFKEPGHTWVLMLGPHDERNRMHDVYTSLFASVGAQADKSRTERSLHAECFPGILPVTGAPVRWEVRDDSHEVFVTPASAIVCRRAQSLIALCQGLQAGQAQRNVRR